jgi:hypothetical protein
MPGLSTTRGPVPSSLKAIFPPGTWRFEVDVMADSLEMLCCL